MAPNKRIVSRVSGRVHPLGGRRTEQTRKKKERKKTKKMHQSQRLYLLGYLFFSSPFFPPPTLTLFFFSFFRFFLIFLVLVAHVGVESRGVVPEAAVEGGHADRMQLAKMRGIVRFSDPVGQLGVHVQCGDQHGIDDGVLAAKVDNVQPVVRMILVRQPVRCTARDAKEKEKGKKRKKKKKSKNKNNEKKTNEKKKGKGEKTKENVFLTV